MQLTTLLAPHTKSRFVDLCIHVYHVLSGSERYISATGLYSDIPPHTANSDVINLHKARAYSPTLFASTQIKPGVELLKRDYEREKQYALSEEKYESLTVTSKRFLGVLHVDNRFVCPFPGCGKAFRVHSTAYKHILTHEGRRHLVLPTPLPDSQLHPFRPSDVPWEVDPDFAVPVHPVEEYKCPVHGCKIVQRSESRIRKHLIESHKGLVQIVANKNRYLPLGRFTLVPPFDAPKDTPVLCCPRHLDRSRKYCPLCQTVVSTYGPRAPVKFYEAMKINFKEISGTGNGSDFTFNRRDQDKGVFYKPRNITNESILYKGRVLETVYDKDGTAHFAVQRLLDYDECIEQNVTVPRDFNIAHEVIPMSMGKSGAGGGHGFEWVDVDLQLVSHLFLVFTTRSDFKYRLTNNMLPAENVYFIRDGQE